MKYVIEDIKQRSRERKGERVLYMVIPYRTETGFEGTVEILKSKFNEKTARDKIEREIIEMAKLEEVKEVLT